MSDWRAEAERIAELGYNDSNFFERRDAILALCERVAQETRAGIVADLCAEAQLAHLEAERYRHDGNTVQADRALGCAAGLQAAADRWATPAASEDQEPEAVDVIEFAPPEAPRIRAHVDGCPQALRVPVDLCPCGGRWFPPPRRPSARVAQETREALARPGGRAMNVFERCVFVSREGEQVFTPDGVNLNGYAIVPLERFDKGTWDRLGTCVEWGLVVATMPTEAPGAPR
jgi:hypothetical protein